MTRECSRVVTVVCGVLAFGTRRGVGFGEEQMETKYIPMMLFSVGSRRWMWSIKDGKNWMNIERTDRLKMYKMTQILFGTEEACKRSPH